MVLLRMQNEQSEIAKLQQQMALIESQAKQYLDKDALSRFGNIKLADPQKAFQIAALIMQAAQSGQITQLNDEEFKNLLIQIQGQKKEFKFTRK